MSTQATTPVEFKPTAQILEVIAEIEADRLERNAKDKSIWLYRKHFNPIAAILGVIAVCGFVAFVFARAMWLIVPLLIIPVPLIIYIFYRIDKRNKDLKKHHNNYIQHVIIPILNTKIKKFTYNKAASIYKKHYPIFKENFPELQPTKSEDILEGVLDDVPITLGEIHVDFKRGETVFCFLCFIAQFNKNIQSKTVVRSRKREGTLPKIDTTGLQEIVLENEQFNRIYQVYTQDEIEARYILTSSFMEKMVELQDRLNGNFWFQHNTLAFLGIDPTNAIDLFEIREESPIYEQTENTYMTVSRLLQLVKILNLDSITYK